MHGDLYDPKVLDRIGDEAAFNSPVKLVMQRIGPGLVTAYDDEQFYCFNSLNMLLPKDPRVSMKYVLGLLNSKLLGFYYRVSFTSLSEFTVNATQGYVGQLPVKLPSRGLTANIVSRIEREVDNILRVQFPSQALQERLNNLPEDTEFDVAVRFHQSHSNLYPVVSGDTAYYVVYPADSEDAIFADSKPKAKFLALFLASKSVKSVEIVSILVPRDEQLVSQIVLQVEEDLKHTEVDIAQRQNEIDLLVYYLYEISPDERATIEQTLSKISIS